MLATIAGGVLPVPEAFDATAWTATLLGLYLLFGGIGSLRNPAAWKTMVAEVGRSPALQLVAGLLELLVGSLIYLANPWLPVGDLLSCILKAVGGLLIAEALMVSGFCDIYAQFWLRSLDHMSRLWSWGTIAGGVVLSLAGMLRFH